MKTLLFIIMDDGYVLDFVVQSVEDGKNKASRISNMLKDPKKQVIII